MLTNLHYLSNSSDFCLFSLLYLMFVWPLNEMPFVSSHQYTTGNPPQALLRLVGRCHSRIFQDKGYACRFLKVAWIKGQYPVFTTMLFQEDIIKPEKIKPTLKNIPDCWIAIIAVAGKIDEIVFARYTPPNRNHRENKFSHWLAQFWHVQ